MQDEFDADGHEPEHDQYLDNDEAPSELRDDDEGDFEDDEDADPDEFDPDDEEDLEGSSAHWDDF